MPTLASLLFKPVSGAFSVGRAALTGKIGYTKAFGNKWEVLAGTSKVVSKEINIGALGQMGIGAGIGAIAGAAGGHDLNSAIEGAAKGAVFGGMAGGALAVARRGIVPAAKGAGRWLTKGGGIGKIGRGTSSAGGSLVRGSARAATFIAEHPTAIAAAVGTAAAGTALYAAANRQSIQQMESPTLAGADISPDYNKQAIAAAEIGPIGGGMTGSAQQMQGQFEYANWMQQVGSMIADSPGGRMAQSTYGLVNGLHAGRHG